MEVDTVLLFTKYGNNWFTPLAGLMLIMKICRAMLIAVLMMAACIHEAKAGEYEGIGLRLCSDFRKDSLADSVYAEKIYFSWAEGFMSGANVARLTN
jgi:hypothetical protein